MLDYESQRKLIIVFVMAAVITIIITIVALVFIWIPKPEKEQKFEVGVVTTESVESKTIVEAYAEDIIGQITEKNIESLYQKIGEDYLEYKKLDKQSLQNMFETKGVWGKPLELETYYSYAIPGYNGVYVLDIKEKSGVYAINIVIREISPYNYTIAFENFVDYKTNVFDDSKNSVQLKINSRIRYTNLIEYDFEIINNFDKAVTINTGATAYPVILVSSSGTVKNPVMTTLATAEVKIEPGYNRKFQVTYAMTDDSDFRYYNTMVLKNITYSGLVGVQNLEYSL